MTQQVSDSEYGRLQKQLDDLTRRVRENSLPIDWVRQRLQKIIEGRGYAIDICWPVMVNYTLSLQEMIRAAGLEVGDSNVNEDNFPINKDKAVRYGRSEINFCVTDLEFVEVADHSEVDDIYDEIYQKLKRIGCRPATLIETLAFLFKKDIDNPLVVSGSFETISNCLRAPVVYPKTDLIKTATPQFIKFHFEEYRFAAVDETRS